ncbi:MAG: methylated-DNA--[protein]-cysteine S-methyltransferase [Actinomycetota bacterium]|nr:methylated-DNA--[protein]-cysteine S-methyltransferase [Actinomycetota bacterium]
MTHRTHTIVDSPIGPLTLVAVDHSLCGLYMDAQRHRPADATFGEVGQAPFNGTPFPQVIEQLGEYFAGDRIAFDLALAPIGTPFRLAVWAELQLIPYGETASYSAIAGRIGNPGAARAVGLANGANPIGIVVPCHRVVGADGSVGGYGGGTERKRWLLDLEQARRRAELRSQ